MRFGDLYSCASRNGLTKPKRLRGKGFKFLNMGELFGNRRIYNVEMDRVPLSDKEKEIAFLCDGDLVFARQSIVASGSGRCAIFLGDQEPVTFDSHLIRVRLDQSLCSPLFFFYFFESPIGRNLVYSITSQGAGVAGITGADLRRLNISFPKLEEQRQIASILGALDDKIENNRKTAATLEEMARALYRSWFVDFDPVHAKAAGESPAFMDEETAALFPDRFGDDGLPEGWEVTSIGSVGEIVGGGTPSKKDPAFWQGGDHLWATPRDLSQQKCPVIFETENCLTDAGLSKISSRLSPPGTVLLSSRAPIGYLAIAVEPISFNQGFIGIRETEAISGTEAYFWCLENMEIIIANSNGSTFQEISKKAFRPIRYLLAPHPTRQAFCYYADTIFRKITILNRENKNLATLRDTLLPKLMSGEIRVGEAREQVEGLT